MRGASGAGRRCWRRRSAPHCSVVRQASERREQTGTLEGPGRPRSGSGQPSQFALDCRQDIVAVTSGRFGAAAAAVDTAALGSHRAEERGERSIP